MASVVAESTRFTSEFYLDGQRMVQRTVWMANYAFFGSLVECMNLLLIQKWPQGWGWIGVCKSADLRLLFPPNLSKDFLFKSGTIITSGKGKVNAIVTSNLAQIVKKSTTIIWMTSPTYRPRLKSWRKIYDRRSSFRTQDPNINTGAIRNPRQNSQLIHDPLCFQNPRICSVYRKKPQSGPGAF